MRPVVAFGSTLYGTSAMNKTIKTLEEQGYSMVAGINGSFFDRSTGIPYGIVITNSILRSGGSANAVGFLADGSAVIGDPEVTVTLDYGGDTPLLVNYNKAMTTQNGVLLYSQDYDTRTKNTIEGYHVIVRPSGSRAAELRLSQTLTVEVVGMVEDTKSCAIPEDGFLLAIANDTIYKNALAALQSLVMGEQLTIQVTCASGWGERHLRLRRRRYTGRKRQRLHRLHPRLGQENGRPHRHRRQERRLARLLHLRRGWQLRGSDARAAGRADAGARLPDRAEP